MLEVFSSGSRRLHYFGMQFELVTRRCHNLGRLQRNELEQVFALFKASIHLALTRCQESDYLRHFSCLFARISCSEHDAGHFDVEAFAFEHLRVFNFLQELVGLLFDIFVVKVDS